MGLPEQEPRIPPLPTREWSPEAIAALAQMTPPEGSVYERRRQERGGSGGVNALALLVRHPALAEAFLAFNRHLLYESQLDERSRELVVLRVAWNLGSPYEWGQHVPVALECGLAEADIARIPQGPVDGWSDLDRALLDATDGLLTDGQVPDESWTVLAEAFDEQTLLDLVFTIGGYATLAMAFNAARLPLDPDIEGFPDGAQ